MAALQISQLQRVCCKENLKAGVGDNCSIRRQKVKSIAGAFSAENGVHRSLHIEVCVKYSLAGLSDSEVKMS